MYEMGGTAMGTDIGWVRFSISEHFFVRWLACR